MSQSPPVVHLRRGATRLLAATVLVALAAVACTEDAAPAASPGWARTLDELHDTLTADHGVTAPSPPEHPGVVRLVTEERRPLFDADGPPPEAFAPLPVTFPGTGDGPLRLDAETSLVCEDVIGLPAEWVADLFLELEVVAGAELLLRFGTTQGRPRVKELLVPVIARPGVQTLHIKQPLLEAGAPSRGELLRVEVAGGTEPVEIDLRAMWILKPLADYRQSTHGWADIEVDKSQRPSFWQSTSGEAVVAFPDLAPGQDVVRGSIAVLSLADDGPPARLAVELDDGRRGRRTLWEGTLTAGDGWIDVEAELLPGEQPALLVLRADAQPAGDVVVWSGWRVADRSRPARRVVLVIIDTLRADVLGCYGHPENETPALDGLAAEGALFLRCFAQAHFTRASMPTIMTGKYGVATGVKSTPDKLRSGFDTLAERFARGGFRTVAFIANGQAGPDVGLGQGYDELVLCLGQDTQAMFDRFVSPRVDVLPDEDLLLYLHLMEPHAPYGPPQPPAGWVDPPGEPLEPHVKYDRPWVETPTARSRIELYGYDVESTDAALGGLLDALLPRWEAQGEPVTVAVLSDHGEFLGELGQWGHSGFMHVPASVQTPLILRSPGIIEPGTRWPDPVENIDVGATLLDLVGIAPWSPARERNDEGSSLVPLLRGELPPASRSTALSAHTPRAGGQSLLGVFAPHGSLAGVDGALAGVIDGPGSTPTDAPVPPALDAHLTRFWESFLTAQRTKAERVHDDGTDDAPTEMDAETLERLRELGYIGG